MFTNVSSTNMSLFQYQYFLPTGKDFSESDKNDVPDFMHVQKYD